MTPKQKAQELIERFSEHSIYWDYYNDEPPDEDHTKECVLICIDEVLESNEKISLKDLSETMETNDILCQLTDNAMYWQEVKKEIENY